MVDRTEPARVVVVTATIPGRERLLARAAASVRAQTIPVEHAIELDAHGDGPGATRNRAIARTSSEWIAFLDDDDELWSWHCEKLLAHAEETGADLVWSQYDVRRDGKLLELPPPTMPDLPGLDELDRRNFIPITYLIRRELVERFGGFQEDFCPEDHQFLIDARDAGMTVSHLPLRTWIVGDHGLNTHGQPGWAWRMYEEARGSFDPAAETRDVHTMGEGLRLRNQGA